MPHTVILGGMGQLASDLFTVLSQDVTLLSRQDLDITAGGNELTERLDQYEPKLVINCAAWNQVDLAESERNEVMHVNAWGVKNLAQYCQNRQIRLIHFSTDHVFSGDERRPYDTDDAPCPVNVYGMSKLAGEIAVRTTCDDYLIIRTCGLYGNLGRSGKLCFPEKILRLVEANPEARIEIVNDQFCTPTYTQDLAIQVLRLLRVPTGTYHVTNAGTCSWFDFAQEILYAAGVTAYLADALQFLVPISSKQYKEKHPEAARRPRYSVLDNERTRLSGFGVHATPQHWTRAIVDYIEERTNLAHMKKEKHV
jgi:dTDP-4-dehydrorhamnose reductase